MTYPSSASNFNCSKRSSHFRCKCHAVFKSLNALHRHLSQERCRAFSVTKFTIRNKANIAARHRTSRYCMADSAKRQAITRTSAMTSILLRASGLNILCPLSFRIASNACLLLNENTGVWSKSNLDYLFIAIRKKISMSKEQALERIMDTPMVILPLNTVYTAENRVFGHSALLIILNNEDRCCNLFEVDSSGASGPIMDFIFLKLSDEPHNEDKTVWKGLTTSILEYPDLSGEFKQRWVNHFAGLHNEPANYKHLQPCGSPFENSCVFYSYVTKNRLILNAAKYGCGRRAVEKTVKDIQFYVQEWMKRRGCRQLRDRVLRKFRRDAYMDHYFVRKLSNQDRKRNAIANDLEKKMIDSISLNYDFCRLKAILENCSVLIQLWHSLLLVQFYLSSFVILKQLENVAFVSLFAFILCQFLFLFTA